MAAVVTRPSGLHPCSPEVPNGPWSPRRATRYGPPPGDAPVGVGLTGVEEVPGFGIVFPPAPGGGGSTGDAGPVGVTALEAADGGPSAPMPLYATTVKV